MHEASKKYVNSQSKSHSESSVGLTQGNGAVVSVERRKTDGNYCEMRCNEGVIKAFEGPCKRKRACFAL